MYAKILVPLDGSRRAEAILPHVNALAEQFESRVIFMQVMEPYYAMVAPYDSVPYYGEASERQRYAEAEAYLSAHVADIRDRGLEGDAYLVYSGDVVRTILETSVRENADLIAMASHGRSGLGRVFYGSVAAGVLHGADRPLLLIRSGAAD